MEPKKQELLDIANRLRTTRGNLTQSQFVEKLSVKQSTYSKYERGARVPDFLFLKKLINNFRINPTWLLTGQGPMQMPDNPAGVETKLLEKLITKVKEHLGEYNVCIRGKRTLQHKTLYC